MSMFEIYLLLVLIPNIHGLGLGLIPISLITTLGTLFFTFMLDMESQVRKIILKYTVPLFFIGIVLSTITPDSDEMKLMVAGSYVTQLKEVKDLPPKTLDLINAFIEKETRELQPKPEKVLQGNQ